MRKSRFIEDQMVAILQDQAAGGQALEVIRRHMISRVQVRGFPHTTC
ncbi:MAG: hypothetical protein ACREMS_08690 [Gemmatimonadaceae bacterium]